MSTAVAETIVTLEAVVKSVGVGTNVGLVHVLWAMLSGAFLESRGGLYPALQAAGFTVKQIRRGGQVLRTGVWEMSEIVKNWRATVHGAAHWQPNCYEGYQPVAADITTFWRPRLQGAVGKFFHHLANRALPGIGVGIVVQVGQISQQRLPILKQLVLAPAGDLSEAALQRVLLKQAGIGLGANEVLIYDAGASIAQVQAAGVARWVVRLARNTTARRAHLPAAKPSGRPAEYGARVRPLARHWKERTLPATPPDVRTSFTCHGQTIGVAGWRNLLRPDQKVTPAGSTYTIWVFRDPRYPQPLIVGTNLTAAPETIFHLYLDRWPVEQLPLVAKQLLGLHRQFVFSASSRARLPQLALLAANILTYLAAVLPAQPTGFWDRTPQATPGRLRRRLAQAGFPKDYRFGPRLREKSSPTAHLPKGIAAHRRQKAA
jgi:hypothetical protein